MEKISLNSSLSTSHELARTITAVLIEKKAHNVRLYHVGEENAITDYYVNVTGHSSTQVMSLADELTVKIAELGRNEIRIEGRGGNSWLLVDYGDVIVNVFDRESREFYNFDRLLPESSSVDISDIIAEVDKKLGINTVKEK